jgi:hypothetical protein
MLLDIIPKLYQDETLYILSKDSYKLNQFLENIPKNVVLLRELKGKEYNNFLHSCTYGLILQDPYLEYNYSSFPSKMLSYLSNGLTVISPDLPSFKELKSKNLYLSVDHYSAEQYLKIIRSKFIISSDLIFSHLNSAIELDKRNLFDLINPSKLFL